MGALECAPSTGPGTRAAKVVHVDALVELASLILSGRQNWTTGLAEGGRTGALNDILRVSTSAGGARANAVIAWNRQTNEVRSGQVAEGSGFDVMYGYNASGPGTTTHQMTMNGKRDGFTMSDFKACGRSALLPRGRVDALVNQVREAVTRCPEFAEQARVPQASRDEINRHLRLTFSKT
jgi:serine/threonine protein kinase HipA of HipAB toxin-antitoxin module